jgi:tetratricopeptide (TPR) repeat protein
MSATALCMHPPCLKDLTTPDEILPTTEVALTMLFEVEFMIAQAENDTNLKAQAEDLAALHMRKSSIFCILDKPFEAKEEADRAVQLNPCAASYYRLGVTQYLLSEFEDASHSLRAANRLDPASAKIVLAIQKLGIRCRSRKDRAVFIDTTEY